MATAGLRFSLFPAASPDAFYGKIHRRGNLGSPPLSSDPSPSTDGRKASSAFINLSCGYHGPWTCRRADAALHFARCQRRPETAN